MTDEQWQLETASKLAEDFSAPCYCCDVSQGGQCGDGCKCSYGLLHDLWTQRIVEAMQAQEQRTLKMMKYRETGVGGDEL